MLILERFNEVKIPIVVAFQARPGTVKWEILHMKTTFKDGRSKGSYFILR